MTEGVGLWAQLQVLVGGLQRPHDGENATAGTPICALFGPPVYKYVRLRWHRAPPEAEALTRAFLRCEALVLDGHDPTWVDVPGLVLRGLRRFLADLELQDAARASAAGARPLNIDFEAAEGELQAESLDESGLQKGFKDAWGHYLLARAASSLRDDCARKGKHIHYQIFERVHLKAPGGPPPSHADVAAEFGMSVVDVTSRLSYTRRIFRAIMYEHLKAFEGPEPPRGA